MEALHFCTLSELSLTDLADITTGKMTKKLKLLMYLIMKSCEF